jgi:hypothetical protein
LVAQWPLVGPVSRRMRMTWADPGQSIPVAGAVRMERRSRRPWPLPSSDQDAPANSASVPDSAAVTWESRVGWLALTNMM